MGYRTTLDEFTEGDEATATPDAIEPVHRWDPTPRACGRCGRTVNALWIDDSVTGMCRDCKDW